MKRCHACGGELAVGRELGRRETCSACGADLHCCMNCVFHDPAAPKQCREPIAELVREKSKANFCDLFRFAEQQAGADGTSEADRARSALDALFRK